MRSAEAAGVDAVIVSNRCFGLTPVVSRTSMGACEHIPLIHENLYNALEILKDYGVKIFGARESKAQSIFQTDFSLPAAIVMGAEDKGISQTLAKHIDQFISIPMLGKIESLNVSVAAAICMYEVVRQRKY